MTGWIKRLLKRVMGSVDEPVTNFVHIPKTAGTSFIVWLDRFFPAERIYPHQLWREVKLIGPMRNQQYDLFRGHFGGGGVRQLTNRPLAQLTILRDPVELARSTYQYALREQNTRVHDLLTSAQMELSEFIHHPETQPLVTNRLIRNISFDFVEDPAAQEVFLSAETIQYLQQHITVKTRPLTDDDRLLRARAFLQACQWFGLAERFAESMQLLCYVRAWRPMGQSQKLNTSSPLQMSDQDISDLQQQNHQDCEFYRFACRLFDERFGQMKAQLETLRSNEQETLDDLLDVHYQRHQDVELSAHVDYRFNQVLQGQQWHRREFLDEEQGYFRWTGPGPVADIDFWVQPGDYQLSIRIINATSEALLDELVLAVNGQQLEWHSREQGVVRVLTATCRSSWIADNGLLRLSLTCADMCSHREAFGTDDERLVGVAVHWIQLTHVG
ncbi:hypothetical protein ACFODZ_11550 [Marinicella sediminis]|uniref:Sulfotransferase family protein n=1 Tax=Marinicella sediminis TaxID=1792834 RepID=A0ABV7JDD4_9GAMM|nr:hypothetical protein [Marinicella sediminis]